MTVVYFNVGTRCLPQLAVSLFTLRQHYAGRVLILSGDAESDSPLLDQMASDPRASAEVKRIPVAQVRRNTAYVTKATLWKYVDVEPGEPWIFLDADTTVRGDIAPLFRLAADRQVPVFTQFANWTTRTRVIAGRLEKWRGVKCDFWNMESCVDSAIESNDPAVNTGVFAACGATACREFLADWERLTRAGWRQFIADEIAAQLMIFGAATDQYEIVDDRFNASPTYGINRREAVIHHYHGKRHIRRPEGRELWLPLYREAVAANFGGLAEWTPAGDAKLAAWLRDELVNSELDRQFREESPLC